MSGKESNKAVILLAEDNDDDVKLLEMAFQKAGYDNPIIRVADGEQALRYLNGQPPYEDRSLYPFPALLLLDLEMPRMNGWELLARLRTSTQWRHLPIAVLTVLTYSSDVQRAYRLGADTFLTKPREMRELVAAVHQLAEYWLPRDVSAPSIPPPPNVIETKEPPSPT